MSNIRTYEITHSEPKTFPIQQKDSTDYLLGGCLVMKNGRIDKYQFEEGYCLTRKAGDKDYFTFCYYDKDHLGNIRQVTQDYNGISNGKVIQTMNYYPFGAEFCDNRAKSFVQNHKYNGKEFDHMHGLNTYDYGARQYNPVTARWDRMDPLSEKYYSTSPYAYCLNNPINAIDPDGRYVAYFEGNNEWIYNSEEQAFFCNDVKFDGDNENLLSLTKALNTLYGTCEEMTSVIDDKKNGVEIGIHNMGRKMNGEGLGIEHNGECVQLDANLKSHVNWDPTAKNAIFSLGHELAHSYDRFNNITNIESQVNTRETYNVNTGKVKPAEIFAVHIENKVRASLDTKLRKYYYYPHAGESLVKKKNQSVYYNKKGEYINKKNNNVPFTYGEDN